jgi:hypothetical protein
MINPITRNLIAAIMVMATHPAVAGSAIPDIYLIDAKNPVEDITPNGPTALIKTRNGNHLSLHVRQGSFSLEAATSETSGKIVDRPDNILPDGEIITGTNNIRRAWLSAPTTRYGHGVLGDGIEAGSVSAVLQDGRTVTFSLPEDSVFEDRYPRLIDINGDGKDEILLVRSYLDRGAALVVLAPTGNHLEIIAEAPAIGLTHRWLNPVGMGDFDGDGINELAAVITPHIGGTLQLYEKRGNRLVEDTSAYGFSNHQMGSRNLGLSAIADLNGDGLPEIVLPDASRDNLRAVSFDKGKFKELFRVPLNGDITSPVVSADLDHDGRYEIITGISPHHVMVICLHP